MSSIAQRFGLAVREQRMRRGWSQEQLAAMAELDRSYLGQIERGEVTPSLTVVVRLAAGLQVQLSALLSRCEPELKS